METRKLRRNAHRPFPDDLVLRLVNEKFNVISVEAFQNIEIHFEALVDVCTLNYVVQHIVGCLTVSGSEFGSASVGWNESNMEVFHCCFLVSRRDYKFLS